MRDLLRRIAGRATDWPIWLVIAGFVALRAWEINLWPFERFPAWDFVWGDTLQMGKLAALRHALTALELPGLNPYVGFAWNAAGDSTVVQHWLMPLNLLALILPDDLVIVVRTMSVEFAGAAGAFLFLRRHTGDWRLSLLGGLTYISLPIAIGLVYYAPVVYDFYLFPWMLLGVHHVLERWTPARLAAFAAMSAALVAAGDIHMLIVLPAVTGVYALTVAAGFYGQAILRSIARSVALVAIAVLAASFYVVPLATNLRTISSELKAFDQAGVYHLPPGRAAISLDGVRGFFEFFRLYGYETLFKPIEGSGFLLYAPALFYLAILVALVFRRRVFADAGRTASIPVALLLVGLAMFGASVVFYLFPALSGTGNGTLRYHINILPFAVVLAGFVCLAGLNRTRDLRAELFALVLIGSLAIDTLLFAVASPGPPADLMARWFWVQHTRDPAAFSSSRIPMRAFGDMWLAIPLLNAAVPCLSIAIARLARRDGSRRDLRPGVVLALIVALPLVTLAAHNEVRAQQAGWQQVARSAYHRSGYLARRTCIDRAIDRSDPSYRTLPVSRDVFQAERGRNWKLLAETEMHVADRQKTLFSYRETMHPYEALLFSTLGPGFGASNWFPPLTSRIPTRIDSLRLMGVRWVLSADEEVHHPALVPRGHCVTPDPPFHETAAGGTLYIYELRNPLPIVFVADEYRHVNRLESLRAVLSGAQRPWTRGVVYLEQPPAPAPSSPSARNVAGLEPSAAILRETMHSFDVQVTAASEAYLVAGYIYRPFWRAFLGSTELPVHRAYGGLMAVTVPPGSSVVTFRYTPYDVHLGLALTMCAITLPFGLRALHPAFARMRLALARRAPQAASLVLVLGSLGACGWYVRSPSRVEAPADAQFAAGHFREAAALYERVLQRDASAARAAARLADAYDGLGRVVEATRACERWSAVAPDDPEAWTRLGWLRFKAGAYQDARDSFARAVARDGARIEAIEGLARSELALGRVRGALEPLRRWTTLRPRSFDAHRLLGQAAASAAVDDEAIAQLEAALRVSARAAPDSVASTYYLLAEVYCRAGQAERCEAARARAEAIDPAGAQLSSAERRRGDLAASAGVEGHVRLALDFAALDGDNPAIAVGRTGQRATVEGTAALTDGPFPGMKAIAIEGQTRPTRMLLPPGAVTLKSGSVVLWARLLDPGKRYSALIAAYTASRPRVIYVYHQGSDGRFVAGYNGSLVGNTARAIRDDTWHHYAFTWSDGRQALYIDGQEAAGASLPECPDEATRVALGWVGDGDVEQWHGAMADVRVFDRSLTAREVIALYRRRDAR